MMAKKIKNAFLFFKVVLLNSNHLEAAAIFSQSSPKWTSSFRTAASSFQASAKAGMSKLSNRSGSSGIGGTELCP
ncbi:hypothetical protein CUMW_149660 [Citrus unshiu]|nr:hypothetical protein CUMW_149660 [Citrus unshiu]